MNTGIQDAHNLAWKLALVHRQEASQALVDSYDAERRPVGDRLLRTTDRLFQVAARGFPASGWLRRWIARPLLARPAIQRRLRAFVSQRNIRYRDSPTVHTNPDRSTSRWGSDDGPRAGDQLPDRPVRHEGRRRRLLEVLAAATGHVLLVVAGTEPTSSPTQRRAFLDEVDGRWPGLLADVWTLVHGPPPADEPALVDPEGELHEALGRGAPGYEIVRPDGHLGARSSEMSPDILDAYAHRLLHRSSGDEA